MTFENFNAAVLVRRVVLVVDLFALFAFGVARVEIGQRFLKNIDFMPYYFSCRIATL